jgi:hypothetical protein
MQVAPEQEEEEEEEEEECWQKVKAHLLSKRASSLPAASAAAFSLSCCLQRGVLSARDD